MYICDMENKKSIKQLLKDNGIKVQFIADILGKKTGSIHYRFGDPINRFKDEELRVIASRTVLNYSQLLKACKDTDVV